MIMFHIHNIVHLTLNYYTVWNTVGIWALRAYRCLQGWYGCTLSFSLEGGDKSTSGYWIQINFLGPSHILVILQNVSSVRKKKIILCSNRSPEQCTEQQEKGKILSTCSIKEYWSPMAGPVSTPWKKVSGGNAVLYHACIHIHTHIHLCIHVYVKENVG